LGRDAAQKVENATFFMSLRTQTMSLIWLTETWSHLLLNKAIIAEIEGQGHKIGDTHLQGHQGVIGVRGHGHVTDMTVIGSTVDIPDIGQSHQKDINHIDQNTDQGHLIKGHITKEIGQEVLIIGQVVQDNGPGLLIEKVVHIGQRRVKSRTD
jgi:hypothetical protein